MRLPGKLIRGPVRPDRNSFARFASLRWAALPVIDRRWTAPMAAAALGFGLFVGVAIGPGTQGTQGASGAMTVQVPETAPPSETATVPPKGGGSSGGGGGHPSGGSGGGSNAPAAPPTTSIPPSSPPVTTPPITAPPVTPPPVTSTTDTGGIGTTTTTTPAEEPTTALAGTVVHINPEAASYTIADNGSLIAIHSHHPPNLGKSIEVDGQVLANGTFAEAGNRTEHGSDGQASFDGTISFSDPKSGIYTVSAAGVSLLVRGTVGHKPPELGDNVEVRVRIADDAEPLPPSQPGEQGCGDPPALPKPPRSALEQVGLRIMDGEPSSGTDVEAIVEGVCRDSRKLIVSADDVRESGRDIAILVPKEFELGRIDPGDVLKLSANILSGGSLQLSSLAGDKGGKGADDATLAQP